MHSKSALDHVNAVKYLSTFHKGSIRRAGSKSCSFFSKEKSHPPPSWITSERRDWKLVSRFCFGQQSPVHRRFYSILYQRSTTSICNDFLVYFARSLNADPQQGNALKKSEKVSVNCTRVIFHLKP